MNIKRSYLLLATVLITTIAVLAQQQASFQIEPSAARLREHVSYLASDALEGRRTGTTGVDEAARYIAAEFSRLGLKPAVQKVGEPNGSTAATGYLQKFPYIAAVELGTVNELKFSASSPPRVGQLSLKDDWIPLGLSN